MHHSHTRFTSSEIEGFKKKAYFLAKVLDKSHCQCLDAIAQKHGYRVWTHLIKNRTDSPSEARTSSEQDALPEFGYETCWNVNVNAWRSIATVSKDIGKLWLDLAETITVTKGAQIVKLRLPSSKQKKCLATLVENGLLKPVKNDPDRFTIPRNIMFMSMEPRIHPAAD